MAGLHVDDLAGLQLLAAGQRVLQAGARCSSRAASRPATPCCPASFRRSRSDRRGSAAGCSGDGRLRRAVKRQLGRRRIGAKGAHHVQAARPPARPGARAARLPARSPSRARRGCGSTGPAGRRARVSPARACSLPSVLTFSCSAFRASRRAESAACRLPSVLTACCLPRRSSSSCGTCSCSSCSRASAVSAASFAAASWLCRLTQALLVRRGQRVAVGAPGVRAGC